MCVWYAFVGVHCGSSGTRIPNSNPPRFTPVIVPEDPDSPREEIICFYPGFNGHVYYHCMQRCERRLHENGSFYCRQNHAYFLKWLWNWPGKRLDHVAILPRDIPTNISAQGLPDAHNERPLFNNALLQKFRDGICPWCARSRVDVQRPELIRYQFSDDTHWDQETTGTNGVNGVNGVNGANGANGASH